MLKEPFNEIEIEQARQLASLTLQMEKLCQFKEQFFASKFDLTPSEFRCLKVIKDNSGITTKDLAKIMELTPGRITHLLNSLEVKNMVLRDIEKEDRRVIQVSLNDETSAFVDNVIEEYANLHVDLLRLLPQSRRVEILDHMKFFFLALKEWKVNK